MAFQTKIQKARFVLGPFSADQMQRIGQAVLDSIAARIARGENADDEAARPLKPGRRGHRGYPDYKSARGLQPIRDWKWSGRTMRSMKVLTASENRVVIGFVDARADAIAHINNLREQQFGVSPKDRNALNAAVLAELRRQPVVKFQRAA
ncbi:MAG TPA: hypothetical protein VN841_29210 [Bryobacteraceae bacterium]|nr:hypothetical protein [Bryobacteraceae bacterium]